MSDKRALKQVTAARLALEKAQHDYPQALRDALEVHGSNEVAQAAGVTRSAMYKALRKAFGPRISALRAENALTDANFDAEFHRRPSTETES